MPLLAGGNAHHELVTICSVKSNPSESEIRDWCVAYLARTFEVSPDRIHPNANFARLGMDSAALVFFIVELEEWLGLELKTEIVSQHQTPAALARYVAGRYAASNGTTGQGD
jgi:acyl carrier protein